MKKILIILILFSEFASAQNKDFLTRNGIIVQMRRYDSAAVWAAINSKLSSVDTGNISNFHLKVKSLFSGTAPITYNSTTGAIGISQATTSTNGYLSSTDWNTFNNKLATNGSAANLTSFPTLNQNTTGSAATLTTSRNIQGVAFDGSANIDIINGTGFVKASGTTLSYDNSTYSLTSHTHTFASLTSKPTTISGYGITDGALSGANTDITSLLLNQTGLVVKGATSNALTIKPNETLTSARTLNIVTGDATRTLTFTGDASISGTHSGTSSGTNTGDQTTVSGNAGTATALQTARNIGGVSFDGTAAIVPQTIESNSEATDATCFPLFVTASGTQQLQPKNNTSLTFNSSNGTLGATTFSGALSGNATTATTLQTTRAIYGNNFDGSAALTQIIASTYGGTGNGFTKFSGPASTEKTFTLPNASATILTDNALVTSAQGGTGNGFTKFSGPATSEKTFTLPNASSTILTDNAVVTVAQGGIGVGTLASNGVLYGNGTGAVNALAVNATATNKFLRQVSSGAPSWQTLVAGDIPDLSGTYQPLDGDLTTIAGLTATTDNFMVANASAWASRTPAQAKTSLSLNNVENTAISTWAGSSNITTTGTITSGGLGTGAVIGGTTMTLGSDGNYDIYYRNSSGVLTRLAAGTDGNLLTTHGTSSAPTWTAPGAGSGDMVLASVQSVTGLKTFDKDKLATKGTSTGVVTISNALTSATNRTFTLPDVDITAAQLTDLTTSTSAATASTLAKRDANGAISLVNVIQGYTTTATAAGTTTLTNASNHLQYFTGSTTQTVKLPATTALVNGEQFEIDNLSTGAVTVQSNGAGAINVLAAGTSAIYTVTNASSDAAASWSTWYGGDIVASGKKLNVSNSITLAGTDATTMTFPSTSATMARTDAGQTFTGQNTISVLAPANSTTQSAIEFTPSGASLETASEQGDMEVNSGGILYYSTAAAERGVIGSEQFVALTSANTLTSQTGVQPIFDGGGGPANGRLTVAASRTYWFEVSVDITAMSTTSGSFSFAMGGTATLTSIRYVSHSKKGTLTTVANAETVSINSASSTVLISANTAAQGTMHLTGTIRVNAAGTLIPQIAFSTVAGPATPVISTDGWIRLRCIGTNTVASIGNWD